MIKQSSPAFLPNTISLVVAKSVVLLIRVYSAPSPSFVEMQELVTVRAVVLHVLITFHTEGDPTARPAPGSDKDMNRLISKSKFITTI